MRGLKLNDYYRQTDYVSSHPTWVRGLKQKGRSLSAWAMAVASYMGAWIETISQICQLGVPSVASYMGAWIETCFALLINMIYYTSHPTWVRGLKHH